MLPVATVVKVVVPKIQNKHWVIVNVDRVEWLQHIRICFSILCSSILFVACVDTTGSVTIASRSVLLVRPHHKSSVQTDANQCGRHGAVHSAFLRETTVFSVTSYESTYEHVPYDVNSCIRSWNTFLKFRVARQ
jgi:hypothetical protein